jgi:AcrR family transcriptional regulator
MNQLQNSVMITTKSGGLRERNRASRQRRILESAATQFRQRGYDQVKIEEIAEAASVSVGTIYNYYKNKGDVLVAIVSMEVNEVLNLGEKIVAKPPASAARAINALVNCYIDHSLTYLSKAMWRQAMSIAMVQPTSPSGKIYVTLDRSLENQTVRLIRRLVAMGLVRTDVVVEALGQIIFHAMDNLFIAFVKDDGQPLAALKMKLRRNIRLISELVAA